MPTTDQELETKRFAILTLSVLLGFATLFCVAGTLVTMLAH